MVLKVTQPLFSASMSGTLESLGTFRTKNGSTFLTHNTFGKFGRASAVPVLSQCFKDAKAAHSAIVPTYGKYFGPNSHWYGWRRSPTWEVFWAQWLVDNPSCLL